MRRKLCLVLGLLGLLLFGSPSFAANRRALLIACSTYDRHPKLKLSGPPNDVEVLSQMLIRKFNFTREDIVVLSDEAGKKQAQFRPLRGNIAREFRTLADQAQPEDSIVIWFGGHGSRQPAKDPNHELYPKPDGLEAILLPANIELWNGKSKTVTNAIPEYELREWTQKITKTGAHLWLTVDACHSAMSLRDDAQVITRGVEPEDLGVPPDALSDASAAASPVRGDEEAGLSELSLDRQSKNFAALYAALPHESAQEGVFARDRKVHGYLTMGMVEALLAAQRPLTYRELATAARQRLDYYEYEQHPTVEGKARDTEVLNHRQQDRDSIVLDGNARDGWRIQRGQLQGIYPDSIFEVLASVEPKAGVPKSAASLGYVRVKASGLFDCQVEPCQYRVDEKTIQSPKTAGLSKGLRCKPAYVSFGELLMRIAVSGPAELDEELARLKQQLAAAIKEKELPAKLVGVDDQPQWIAQFRGDDLLLLPAGTAQRKKVDLGDAPLHWPRAEAFKPLLRELRRIARGQNLLTLAQETPLVRGLNAAPPLAQVEAVRLQDNKDRQGVILTPHGGQLEFNVGDIIGWRIINEAKVSVDVTLLLVDDQLKIKAIFPRPGGSLDNRIGSEAGENRLLVARTKVTQATKLDEHMVLIAVESPKGDSVSFAGFAEEFEEGMCAATVRGTEDDSIDSPLGELLQTAIYASCDVRGAPQVALSRSSISSVSWRIENRKAADPPRK